ncbi:hypothetical protein GGF37_001444 [Kickxella alabastrina]|nr:hypothetical protein GGF37_001444 [Kickxella alabastrina]
MASNQPPVQPPLPHSPPSETRKKQKTKQHSGTPMRTDESQAESGRSSPMAISTPTTAGGPAENSDSAPLRTLMDTDAIRVKIAVDYESAPEDLRAGLRQVAENHNVAYFYRTECGATAQYLWTVRFEPVTDEIVLPSGSYEVSGSGGDFVVRYHRIIDAFRALGQVLTAARAAEVAASTSGDDRSLSSPDFTIAETAQFETLALMIDCSRNGVLCVKSIFAMLRNMALMGFNMLQLYTEDTYKVADEPFFGYLRGGYTQQELRTVDDYAYSMGIEVVACIQTLGHLGQILQWPRYAGIRDTNEVVLSRLPETYALLEKLIATVSAPLRSRRIHIGMDEAYGVGEGRFRTLFGAQEGTAIFVEHLGRVNDICKRHGLRPMLWSDMLFCLAAKNNALYAYYDQTNSPASALAKVEGIPPDVDLVFWDYYHTAPEIYTRKIQQHRELGCANPWMASGAWTWTRFWCHLPFSFESNRASLVAAKSLEGRVSSFMLTIWGDEGNECDFFSALPVMLYAGNHAYTAKPEIDVDFMENTFAAICGGSLGDWMHASRIDEIPQADTLHIRAQLPSNMSKWVLWEDPMLSFMSPQYETLDLEVHFTEIADRLLDCALSSTNSGMSAVPNGTATVRYPLNRLLRMPGLLARVLELKCNLRAKLVGPYRAENHEALLQVAETRLRPLIEAQRELWLYHRSRWHRIYKPFGWETLELRYGGLTARLQTMYDRIVAYCLQQPCSSLRRSRAIGIAAGVSRHPGLLPQSALRSRNPSKCADNVLLSPKNIDNSQQSVDSNDGLADALSLVGGASIVPGPSMSADDGSGVSLGAAPSWLPVVTTAAAADAMPIPAMANMQHNSVKTAFATDDSPEAEAPLTSIGLGWPVTAATTVLPSQPVQSLPQLDTAGIEFGNSTTTPFPQPTTNLNDFMPVSAAMATASQCTDGVITINALGVHELGGEGDFWLQPAPLLPPELNPILGVPSGIGCLGEEDDNIVDSIPELDEDLHCIYENAYTSLLLDYGRVSAPSRLG